MINSSVVVSVQGGCSDKPYLNNQTLTECPLLDVDICNAPIQDVEHLRCGHLAPSATTDPCYVFQVLDCCHKLEGCLQNWYGPNILQRITDQCILTYTGNINAQRVIVDLDFGRLDFEGFSIQCGSQTLPF